MYCSDWSAHNAEYIKTEDPGHGIHLPSLCVFPDHNRQLLSLVKPSHVLFVLIYSHLNRRDGSLVVIILKKVGEKERDAIGPGSDGRFIRKGERSDRKVDSD